MFHLRLIGTFFVSSAPPANQPKPDTHVIGSPKLDTPSNQNTLSINSSQSKSLSDTEVETRKKEAEDGSPTKTTEKKDNALPPEVFCFNDSIYTWSIFCHFGKQRQIL